MLTWKEPLTFSDAPGPNTQPAGFSRKRFAPGKFVVWIVPWIADTWPPVTRPRIFATPAPVVLLKFAMSPVPTLKSPKLWNRLLPARVPPVMSTVLPSWLTSVPSAPAPGVGVIAVVTWAWAAIA